MNLVPFLTLILAARGALVEGQANELFRDCTRELYDRVVRFEYLYYEGYWMYPYNKLRNHGPSYHYTEKDFCKYVRIDVQSIIRRTLSATLGD